MCIMHPLGFYECDGKFRSGCVRTITLPEFSTVGEEFDELEKQGWVIIPHTGTYIYCSERCWKESWARDQMPRPIYNEYWEKRRPRLD